VRPGRRSREPNNPRWPLKRKQMTLNKKKHKN